MNNEYIIDIENISCKVGYKYLLRDISWQVKKGERWVVFGMNGCGKTTLLSIIAGFKQYTSGSLKMFGSNIDDMSIISARKRVGWVSASFFDKYYSSESVLDIVLSGKYGTLGVDAYASLQAIKRAKTLLLELNLDRRSEYTFDMLSKGERQNVLIARALFSQPEILVLDEPCTGLDIYNREYLFQTLEQIAEKKDLTIIYVTHYVEEIKPFFTKTLLLKNGHIFQKGDTEKLLNSEIFEEFLGYPVVLREDYDNMRNIKVLNVDSKIINFM